MRNIRQSKIVDIITKKEIKTQSELADELFRAGLDATQATVSRDIKELGLIKVAGADGKYRYALLESDKSSSQKKMFNLFRECVISIQSAKNLVVVKTLSGNGSNAGMCVDTMGLSEIIGSVAGDDTLLIVTADDNIAVECAKKLNSLIQ